MILTGMEILLWILSGGWGVVYSHDNIVIGKREWSRP